MFAQNMALIIHVKTHEEKKFECKVRMIVCYKLSRVVRKPAFCICENKDADQLRGSREADQHLCFHYTDSTTPLLPKSEISRLKLSSQPGLCRTWSETPKTGFLTTRLNSFSLFSNVCWQIGLSKQFSPTSDCRLFTICHSGCKFMD